jgi:hypothetical protein
LTFIAWPGREAVLVREREAIAANMSILARSTTNSRAKTAAPEGGLAEMAGWCVEDFADIDISASIFSCHPAHFSQIPAHVLIVNRP